MNHTDIPNLSLAALLVGLVLAASPGQAAPVTVQNPSFETAGTSPDWVPGWMASSDAFRTRTAAPGPVTPTDGVRQAWMNNGTHGYQDTGETIVSGTTYTLNVDLNADQQNFPNIETVIIRLYGSDLGRGTALAEITSEGPTTSGWLTDQTVSFAATGAQATGQTLGIYLEVTSGTQVEWDNVRLDASATGDDTTPPAISSTTPADGATRVSVNTALEITFNELVQKGTGSITIKNSDGGAVIEMIDVTSENVMFSGGTKLTISLSNPLPEGTGCYVEISDGAIKDLADNDFPGISDPDTWNFTTLEPTTNGAIAVANGSFETAGTSPDWVPGWTASNGSFRTRTSAPGNITPTDGERQAWMNNGTHGYQDTGEPIVSGTTYTLTVDLGADQDNFLDIETVIIRLYGSDLGTSTALAEITPEGPISSGWLTGQTVSFTATGAQDTGQTLGIYLEVTSGTQVEWDNVRLNAEIAAPFAITKISLSPDAESVELTWGSKPGEEFFVKYSTDMSNWEADLDDGVEADAGDSTTRSYGIAGLATEGEELFFRVEKQ